MPLSDDESYAMFTPSEEEQTLLILQGKCPHNMGWIWWNHDHNSDAYRCIGCGEWRDY